ncbi:S-adenosyl-L-methionine-dependent methyltransferase [Amylostereum chailletii]|nr:S-adenosyl-L-methionine-dependent methyltransferase [Amylostereum chailletii]
MPDSDRYVSTTPRANLDALLGLIKSATASAVAEYENTGYGVPSLDSQIPHPGDSISASIALRKAIRTLEAACHQLCATLTPPTLSMASRGMTLRELSVMKIAIEARVSDILREHPRGLHVTKISERTSIESGKLARVLRLLAVKHVYREVAPDVFANNRLSLLLASSHPTSSLLGHWLNEGYAAEGNLYQTLVDSDLGPSYAPLKSAFATAVTDQQMTMFEWFVNHPRESERFGKAMIGYGYVSDSAAAVDNYPWGDLPKGTSVCDVGGGIGSVLILLARKQPHLRLTLQDLPNVVEQAQGFWRDGCPEAIQERRIQFTPLNFFEQSPEKNQDVYYLKQVFHDWPDEQCRMIIRNIRKVMKPGSRLLIHDYVLRKACRGNNGTMTDSAAPLPLLPTWGAGNSRPYAQDINMMALHNSKERTFEEFVELGNVVGLKVVKLWDFVETGMVEFILE